MLGPRVGRTRVRQRCDDDCPQPSRRSSPKSQLCAVLGDIHFPHHHQRAWESFVAWCRDWRPARVIINGDALDFEALSRFAKTRENVDAIDEIKTFVREVARIVDHVGQIEVMEGNHDERWGNIFAAHAIHLEGAIGLTLEEQCRFQGLDQRVKWTREDIYTLGIRVGPFWVRHGHKQTRGFGPQYIAATRLRKTLGDEEIVNHHHRAQMHCVTAFGKMARAVATPAMTNPHNYAPGADWQTGFTVVECFGDDATAYPVVMTLDGRFAWGGSVYDGSAVQSAPVSTSSGHAVEVDGGAVLSSADNGGTVRNTASAGGLDYDDVADTSIGPPRVPAPQSRRAFADEVGVPESTLRDWEKREGKPWWEYKPAV